MKNTTLCYIEKDDCYLMLHRSKKQNDPNHDKWLGIGGKFEDGESPEDCLVREVYEETGLRAVSYRLEGIVTFASDIYETEYMYLYTCSKYEGDDPAKGYDCGEGELCWVKKDEVLSLPLWEGDYVFLERLINGNDRFFSLKLIYEGDHLADHELRVYF